MRHPARRSGAGRAREAAAGDALLQHVAQELTQWVADGEVAARLGGDQFALLLSDAPGGQRVTDRRTALDQSLHDLTRRVPGARRSFGSNATRCTAALSGSWAPASTSILTRGSVEQGAVRQPSITAAAVAVG